MGTQRVIVAMPDELVAAIDRYAATEERSRSSVIRRALQAVMQPDKSGAGVAAAMGGVHAFTPQPGNALRCECGTRRGDHA